MNIASFDVFAATLLTELELALPGEPHEDTDLLDDLDFDSMLFAAALGVMDQMGATVDDQALAQAGTLGALYHLYAVALASQADDLPGSVTERR